MRYLSLLIAIFLLAGCGCSDGSMRGVMRVGIDRQWYPLAFGEQTAYVNGYTEDLLIEISNYSGIEFELINANFDSLEQGLKEDKYDVILTSMPPYEYNKAHYEFSSNFLDTGPVLVIPFGSKMTSMNKLTGAMVGILTNDPSVLILEKDPTIIIRSYSSIPNLFNSLAKGEIKAALIDQIPAAQYVGDLYAGVLMIGSEPMSDTGLHMVGRSSAVEAFNKSLKSLKRKKTLSKLRKKWELSI